VALGSFLLVGGIGGAVMGVALAVVVLVVVPRMETIHARRRRDRLSAQSPLAIDLVTACLASGAGVESALAAAARAVGEPLAGVLDAATTALALGADPVAVWRDVGTVDSLSSLARALARSADTGAGLAALLPRVAEEARATQRARIEERVRTASVRLTAPLGLAFLPAFVLLGVVPVVASWVGVLL
jgi:Flp pilus assembly protein TadB